MKNHLMNGVANLYQFERNLHLAHDAAVKSHQQFAEILLHGMIEDLGMLQHRLGRILDATIMEENAKDEGEKNETDN